MFRWLVISILAFAPQLQALEVPVTYLSEVREEIPILSELETTPADLGVAGAQLGLSENLTTGKFLDQNYQLQSFTELSADELLQHAKAALSQNNFLIINSTPETLLKLADLSEAQSALIFNAGAEATELRESHCRRNVLHTIPSLAMRTDALMQFLKFRQWDKLVLISGEHPSDLSYAQSLRSSMQKLGVKSGQELEWKYDADMRRSAFSEGPLFSQAFDKAEVVLVADEVHDFGRYLMYNTWSPQIFAGSEGLQSEAWSSVMEQWGATQLQNRFAESSGRKMLSEDYAAWAAIRAIGEAVTRTNSADPSALRQFLLSPDFELAGFKGEALSFRDWNGQMRQPMPIFHERALVATAPMEGYLHEFSELDTLGIDRPQSQCKEFGESQ